LSTAYNLADYPTLKAWFESLGSNVFVDGLEISLGDTGDQFFARQGNQYRWKGVHSALNDRLVNLARGGSKKAHVTLGTGSDFLLYEEGSANWALGNYPSLDKVLEEWNVSPYSKGNLIVS
jgi:hypothetical protein